MTKSTPNYGSLSASDYTARINTPAQNPLYHETFHVPLIEEARQRSTTPTLVDVASGHAHELEPIVRDNKDIRLVAIDLSKETLVNSTMQRIQAQVLLTLDSGDADALRDTIVAKHPENIAVAADARDLQNMTVGFADAGIALNAMVYIPHIMLRALRACLNKDAPASVNFRNASNPYNSQFYRFYTADGGTILEDSLDIGNGISLPTRVLDYRSCRDVAIHALDRQTYLTSTDDMARLIEQSGFAIEAHQPFHFASPSNRDNEIDVFKLRAI